MIPVTYRVFRDMDDDYAPVDYSYVSSANEAARQRQQQNIKRPGAAGAAARHRAEPSQKADAYGIRAREIPKDNSVRGTVMRKLPSLEDGAPQAASVAYPDDFGIPDNPFVQPPERRARTGVGTTVVDSGVREERRTQRRARAVTPSETAQNEPQLESSSGRNVPEWLLVAKQNPMTSEDMRARAPLVKPVKRDAQPVETDPLGRPRRHGAAQPVRTMGALPQSASEYEEAGYPEELLRDQTALEMEIDEQNRRRRHGAQYAVNPYQQREYEQSLGYSRPSGRTESYPPDRSAYAEAKARRADSASANQRYRRDGTRGSAYEEVAGDVQYAYHPARMTAYDTVPEEQSPYRVITDRRDEYEDEYEESETERRASAPWLMIAMLVAAAAAVGLWLMQLSFARQASDIIRAREKAAQELLKKHPYGYRELIEQNARENNLNPAFVAAIVLNESSFNPNAVSNVGARGLMQLMDDTAGWIYEKMGDSGGYSFDSMFSEESNLRYGCWYLAFLCERFRGDPVLVAAAYHAGQNTVQNWLNDSRYSDDGLTIRIDRMMDGPTKQYAARVTNDYAAYMGLYYSEGL